MMDLILSRDEAKNEGYDKFISIILLPKDWEENIRKGPWNIDVPGAFLFLDFLN
jgi:hypothetical protein